MKKYFLLLPACMLYTGASAQINTIKPAGMPVVRNSGDTRKGCELGMVLTDPLSFYYTDGTKRISEENFGSINTPFSGDPVTYSYNSAGDISVAILTYHTGDLAA
jgi:hypothetical protein